MLEADFVEHGVKAAGVATELGGTTLLIELGKQGVQLLGKEVR
jgi:hypothetical protein